MRFSVMASERGARHHYTFPAKARPRVAVDVSAGGLMIDGMITYPQGGEREN